MKTRIVSLLFVLVSAFSLKAGDAKLSGVIKIGITSQSLTRPGTIVDRSPIWVNEIILFSGEWYGGVWNSTSLSSHSYGTSYGDEFDLYAGWARTFDWIKVDVCATYCTIADLDKADDDLWMLESEISFPKCPFVQPYMRLRYFGEVGSKSFQSGMFYFVGIRKSISFASMVPDKKCTLNLELSTAYAGGALSDSTGFVYGRVTVGLDIPLTNRWTFSPSVIYQVAAPGQQSDPQGFTDGNKFVTGFSIGYSF